MASRRAAKLSALNNLYRIAKRDVTDALHTGKKIPLETHLRIINLLRLRESMQQEPPLPEHDAWAKGVYNEGFLSSTSTQESDAEQGKEQEQERC
jgi:hypothetical protein